MPGLTVPPNFFGSSSSDTIQATTTANDIGIQVDGDGVLDTRGGNDTVSGTGTGDSTYGISDVGYIALGSGNDSFSGTASFAGFQVTSEGILDAGSGSDIISGIANSTGFTHNAYGILTNGSLTGGNGDDLVRGEARGVVSGNVSAGLEGSGILDGRNGNDTITGIGINENGFGIGIRTFDNGSVYGGNGNDIITGYGTTTGIGLPLDLELEGDTIIDGGNGDDYLKARIIDSNSTAISDQGGAVANALILGGKGNDIFDVGYGSATLDGGQGFDTLVLPGSADDYSIQGYNEDLTIVRDSYVLNALNIENIDFLSDALWL